MCPRDKFLFDHLGIPCCFQPEGCEEIVALAKEDEHLKACTYRIVCCPRAHCAWWGLLADEEEHLKSCVAPDTRNKAVQTSMSFPIVVREESESEEEEEN